ncbi:MAG: PEP-CTERM sorting domain-containing protein [Verrucomicrobiota bacterium]
MKTIKSLSPKALTPRSIAAILAIVAMANIGQTTVRAATLTGGTLFSANATGTAAGFETWNTVGGDAAYNFYLTSGGLAAPFINSGNGGAASPSAALPLGTHTFSIFAESASQGALSHYGLNLYFNGGATPSVSVFAPRTTSSIPPYPAFSANSSLTTPQQNLTYGPAAGTLSFASGGQIITLTSYFFASPETVFSMDRVSPVNNVPSGFGDYVGQFTLNVTPVPEPTTAPLVLLGLFAAAALKHARRPRNAKA